MLRHPDLNASFPARLGGFLIGLLLNVLAASVARADSPCHLTFGWTSWEPYQYRTEDGRLDGIDLRLMTEAARRMGCALAWEEGPRSRLMARLREGRIDAIAGLARTDERTVFGLYSHPYREGPNVLVVRRGESGRWHCRTLEELAGLDFRLGIILGAMPSREFEMMLLSGRLARVAVQVPTVETARAMLQRGRIDGYFDGALVLQRLLDSGRVGGMEAHPLSLPNDAYVLFSRRSVTPDTVGRFDAVLDGMAADGSRDAIVAAPYP
ncbi:amino acid ABC transporter, periplasmic amino acid-binding protein, putative [Rhodospirillum centenum SW]|uniref:Amino acid ABC transporter, periplasmic amino acid-binding protein, putative n=1 Tax=Rhodospirillum centenum (strain ATCC 51521 / SW) TaxID=414684 RepID=B6IYD4_RHOCS|nr:amino acid ABC transporter, periplasmic amino acid-binding protein, putative [Rhodospirillum centenum SW]